MPNKYPEPAYYLVQTSYDPERNPREFSRYSYREFRTDAEAKPIYYEAMRDMAARYESDGLDWLARLVKVMRCPTTGGEVEMEVLLYFSPHNAVGKGKGGQRDWGRKYWRNWYDRDRNRG